MLVRASTTDEVRLTPTEVLICELVGKQWLEENRRLGRDPGLGPTREQAARGDASNSIRGIKAQWACAICLNMYWRPSSGDLGARDVGGLIEVRTTVLTSGRLIIKPEDIEKNYDTPFVLVHCCPGELYRLLGWLFAWQAEAYPVRKGMGDDAHFIEQSELASIDELRRWIIGAWLK